MRSFLIIFFVSILSVSAVAGDRIELSVDRTDLQVGEVFQLELQIVSESGNIGNHSNPEIAGLENFRVVNQSQSSNISIVNGKYTASKSLTFGIVPEKPGKFKIGPAKVKFKNQTHNSNVLNLNVLKTGQAAPDTKVSKESKSRDIFLQAEPSKRRCYVYEPVKVVYKLYTRLNVENFDVLSLPKATNFWVEQIETKGRIKQYHKMIDDKKYLVAELKEVYIFPTQSGKQTISPMVITCNVRVQSRDPFFDDFFSSSFFGKTKKMDLSSTNLTLNVLPLPAADRPAGMIDNNVGVFQISSTVNQNQVKTNEGITYKLRISGTGNIKMISPPELTFPKSFKTYQSNTVTNSRINQGSLQGERVLEYALIPARKGNYTLDPVVFNYFDINEKKYKTIQTKPIQITVQQGEMTAQRYSGFSQAEVDLLHEDIRFIKSAPTAIVSQTQDFPVWLWFVYFLGLAIVPLAFLHSNHIKRLHSDKSYARSFAAAKESKKRLSLAGKVINSEDIDDYYNELYNAIVKFICDKTGTESADLDIQQIKNILTGKNVEDSAVEDIARFLDKCQLVRFSPVKPETKEKNDDFGKAKNVLEKLLKLF